MPATADPANEKARSFIDSFLGEPKPIEQAKAPDVVVADPPKVEAKVEPPVVADPPKVEAKVEDPAKVEAGEPAKVEPVVTKKTKVKKEEPAPAPDYSGVAEAAARGVAEAMAKRPPAPTTPEAPKLPDQELRRVNYLSQLEKMFPDKYPNLAKRYEKSYHEVEKYQRKWEAANPGETFDAADTEHTDFLAKQAVDWEDEDYAEAVAEVKSDAVRRETEQKYAAQERRRDLEPAARRSAKTQSDRVVAELAADLKEVADVLGDNGAVDPEKLEKLIDADPVRGPVVAKAAEFASTFVAEANRLFTGAVSFDSKKALHNTISEFAANKERALLALPRDQQADSQGRQFVSSAEFYKLSPAQRDRSWTLQADDIAYLATQEIVADAKKSIASEEARIERIMKVRGAASAKAPAEAAKEPAKAAAPAASKPVSPSGGLDPKVAGVKGDPSSESQTRWTAFQNRFLGVK